MEESNLNNKAKAGISFFPADDYRDKQADLYTSSLDYIGKQERVPFVKEGFKGGWDAAKEELLKEFEWFFCDAYCMNYGNPDYCKKCPVRTKMHWLTGDFKQAYDKKNSNSQNNGNEYKFRFRQLVMVRPSEDFKWCAAEFSHIENESWYCVLGGMCYRLCIPFNDKTKHLLGTNENWEDEK